MLQLCVFVIKYLRQNASLMHSILKMETKEFKELYTKKNHMTNAFEDKLQIFDETRNFHLTEESGLVLYDLLHIVLHFENCPSIIRQPKEDRELTIFDFRDFDKKEYGVDVIKLDEPEYLELFGEIENVVQYFAFLFLLIQYILDYGIMITKHSLKFKLAKCLDHLEKSMKSTQLVYSDVDWYPVFVHWLHILRLKYFIRSIMFVKASSSISNRKLNIPLTTLIQTRSKAAELLQNCKKSKILDENWRCTVSTMITANRMVDYAVKRNLLLDCDFELARVLIGKPSSRLKRLICHKIDDKIFVNLNKVSKKRKHFCLIKRFELVKDYGSIRGCNYIKKIKNQVGQSKFKNVIKLLVFLGLSRYGLNTKKNINGNVATGKEKNCEIKFESVQPFALQNLCSLKQCENCLVKFVKLHRCTIDDEVMFFCSGKCEYAVWERLNRHR